MYARMLASYEKGFVQVDCCAREDAKKAAN
jgi:hypothetical protein